MWKRIQKIEEWLRKEHKRLRKNCKIMKLYEGLSWMR